jgi:hypothetical protein
VAERIILKARRLERIPRGSAAKDPTLRLLEIGE